jgi:hypothetical protein
MTGIYILKTLDGYRVCYSNLFVKMLGSYNDKKMNYNVVPEIAKQMFEHCEVLPNIIMAISYANQISNSVPETDDGVFVINNFSDVNFEDLVNGNSYS